MLPGARIFRDELAPKERQARRRDLLLQRSKLLRNGTRKDSNERTVVASIAVLDWTLVDTIEAIAAIHKRGGGFVSIQPPLEVWPHSGSSMWGFVARAFEASKTRASAEVRGKLGGQASGERRRAASLAKVEAIRDRWRDGDPREHRTADLLAEAGLTRNTVIDILGKRRRT